MSIMRLSNLSHFNYPEIDYDKLNEEETFHFIVDLMEQQKISEVKIDNKDIDFIIQTLI
jgi:polyhydroxyalkanoate synthesis regulator phasin